MYASIRIARGNQGEGEEMGKRIENEFLPVISGVQGLVAYYCVDAGDDTIIAISVFNDKAGADESNKVALGWVQENLAPLMSTPLEVKAGKVIVSTSGSES